MIGPAAAIAGVDVPRHAPRGLWICAALAAVALHAGCIALVVLNLNDDDIDDTAGAPGLVVGFELAAPTGEPTDLPPGPESEASAAFAAQAEQKTAERQTELPKDTPQDTPDPDRLVAPAAPTKKEEIVPDAQPAQTTPSAAVAASEATAMPTLEAAPQSDKSVTLAEGVGAAKQRERATWQKELVAHLDRHKRYPADRSQQAAQIQVAFSIDRKGHLLSSSIVKSSGDASFDAAALSMLKRSDPLPPPPPLIADDGLSFTVPVIFRVKGKN